MRPFISIAWIRSQVSKPASREVAKAFWQNQVTDNKKFSQQFSDKIHEVLSSSYEVVAEDAHSWFQLANYSVQPNGSLCKVDYGGENDLEVLVHFLKKLKQIRIQ